eukprot:1939758-Amphidinium_carterae.1
MAQGLTVPQSLFQQSLRLPGEEDSIACSEFLLMSRTVRQNEMIELHVYEKQNEQIKTTDEQD